MKIKSKSFILGTWCHSLMSFETQSIVKKKVIIDFAMCTICTFFKNLPIEKLLAWLQ